ncbi:DUF6357 family protein [Streptomyces sp. NPDC059460]|uniref:DUF6357 family protein n=1 Tax=Streptomyces sp. NPDC059460 TaxID=3346840 RepID=UPI0036CA8DF9
MTSRRTTGTADLRVIRADFIRHLLLWSAILPLCSAAGRSRRGRLISLLALRVVLGLVVPIELVEAALVFRLVAAVTSRRIRTAEGAPATSLPGQHCGCRQIIRPGQELDRRWQALCSRATRARAVHPGPSAAS